MGKMTQAINSIMQKTPQGIINGIMIMGSVITEIPADLKTCQGVTVDVARISVWAAKFANPAVAATTISWNVSTHLFGLIKDTTDIIGDVKTHNFADMGTQVGSMIVQVLGPVSLLEMQQLYRGKITRAMRCSKLGYSTLGVFILI